MRSSYPWSVALRLLHGIAFLGLMCATPAVAQEPPSVGDTADRPGFADSPVLLGPGHVQVEFGFRSDHQANDRQSVDGRIWPQLELHAGVLPRLDVIGFWGGVLSATASTEGVEATLAGATDFRVGAKLGLLDRPRLAAALIGYLNVPVGSATLSSRYADPALRLAWGVSLSDRVGLSGTGDLKAVRETDGNVHAKPAGSVQFASAIRGTLEGFVAVAAEPPGLGSRPTVVSVETGVVLAIGDATQIDLWGSRRISGGPEYWFIGAGYVRRLR